jgi:hypothetical protein
VVEVALDVVGWQCGRTVATCGTGPLVGVPDWSWLRDTGPRLAATALVPLGVVLLLWWLAHSSWSRAEAVTPLPADGSSGAWVSPLESRSFWNGGEAVANLRAFHITAALAVVGLGVATPVLVPPGGGLDVLWSSAALLPRLVAAVLMLVLAACVVGVAAWPLTDRRQPRRSAGPPARFSGWRSWLPTGTLALVVVAAVRTALGGDVPAPGRPPSVLPWLTWTIGLVFWSQVALVAALTVLTFVQARSLPQQGPAPVPDPASGEPVLTVPAWRGLALPAFALLGWIAASGFAAALTLRVADTVGTPIAAVDSVTAATRQSTAGAPDPYAGKQVLLPVGYFWTSAAAVLVVLVVLAVAVTLFVLVLRSAGTLAETVAGRYDVDPDSSSDVRDRVKVVARAWAFGLAPNRARSLAAAMVGGTALVLLVGLVGYGLDEQWIVDHGWAALLGAGNLVMTLAIVALLYVGRKTYSDPRFRRNLGILWDVGTFWPRATHPLAPPSYGERAIPDLLHRIEGLTLLDERDAEPSRRDAVVLSCHSQGSVIGAAVVAASRYAVLKRTALLTYGDPLRRLYARFFPAYFGPDQLERLGRLLVTTAGPHDPEAPVTDVSTVQERACWPWRNLQRPSDPIGGAVFVDAPLAALPDPAAAARPCLPGDVDVTLVDPVFARSWGDRSWPLPLAHSDYVLDPIFPLAVTDVVWLRRRAPASAQGPGQPTTAPPWPSDQAQTASPAAAPTIPTRATTPR